MSYRPPGPDPGPGWYGSPTIGWSDVSPEDARANFDRSQAAGPAPGGSALRDRVLAEFPFMAVYLDIPELAGLIERGVAENWSPDRFQGQVRSTNWWKATNQAQQSWIGLSKGEQDARVDEWAAYALSVWQQVNGTEWLAKNPQFNDVHGAEAQHYGRLIASGAWSKEKFDVLTRSNAIRDPNTDEYVREQQRREELARLRKRPEEIAEQLWQQARGDYFVSVSKDAAKEWATRIINGTGSYGEFNDYLRSTAISQFPAFKDAIANGVKPGVLFDPFLNIAAEEYGTSREAVIANDKLWGQLIQSAAGKAEMPTTADWLTYVREQPEFEKSLKGQRFGTNLAAAFGRTFGEAV